LKKNIDIKLLILGEGEDECKLKKQITDLNLKNNVFLLGKKENIFDYLNVSNVFVLSSLWEGLPLSLLEAMACGLPVVATNVGGIPEVVKDGLSGFLVEPKNPTILAKKIEYLLNLDIESRKKMGAEGRKIVESKFSLEKMVNNYENLYQDFLNKLIK
jgi:glycosyltransferase involved in cell wall biosynthesis